MENQNLPKMSIWLWKLTRENECKNYKKCSHQPL